MIGKPAVPTIALLLSALFSYSCVSDIVPATGQKQYLGYTWKQETELGKQASKEIAGLFGIYRDAKIARYVTEVGNRVLATSHLRHSGIDEQIRSTPVNFGVLDSPIVNAMALPGGYIYITRGMLAHLNSEEQLAMVLAHEIGHITARHAARQAWQQQIGQSLLLGGAIIGQGLGLPAEGLLNVGGAAAQLLFLRYSRDDELEADKLGIEYSSAAGYDPRDVIGLFQTLERMQEKETQGMPNFLATHPDPGARIQRIRELTAAQPRDRQALADKRFLEAVEGLVLGEDPRQGFVDRDVFYHPDLRFRFPVPRGFKLINQPTQVLMVENQKRAVLGFATSGAKSLETAVGEFIRQPGIRIVDRGPMRSDGLPAFFVVADAQQQSGQIVRVLAYFVEYRGSVYYFAGYSAASSFGVFRSAFLQTMQGFGEIRDSQVLNRQPVRLTLQSVTRPAQLRDQLPKNLPAPFTAEDVALLNQSQLNQEIAPGKVLKLPAAR